MVAAHQAEHAADPVVRAAHRTIARDEARHALLSLALHDWARTRLTAHERRRIDETRARGLARVTQEAAVPESEELVRVAGLPTAERATELASQLG